MVIYINTDIFTICLMTKSGILYYILYEAADKTNVIEYDIFFLKYRSTLNLKLIQHFVIKFVSDLRQVSGFLWVLLFPPPIKLWPPQYNWNVVESGIKHHQTKTNQIEFEIHVSDICHFWVMSLNYVQKLCYYWFFKQMD